MTYAHCTSYEKRKTMISLIDHSCPAVRENRETDTEMEKGETDWLRWRKWRKKEKEIESVRERKKDGEWLNKTSNILKIMTDEDRNNKN